MSVLGIFYEFVIRLIKFTILVFFIKSYSKFFLLNPIVNILLNPIVKIYTGIFVQKKCSCTKTYVFCNP